MREHDMQPITVLIDPGTRVARTMTAITDHRGKVRRVASGYLAFVSAGKLQQRKIYPMHWDSVNQSACYILHKGIQYAVNVQSKPISGAFNKESLFV